MWRAGKKGWKAKPKNTSPQGLLAHEDMYWKENKMENEQWDAI